MVSGLTNLKPSILAWSRRKSSRVWMSVQEKSGPLGNEPADVVLGSALIFVSLDVAADLD